MIFLVRRGDVVITRQDALHGDLPAICDFSRCVLVINFY